MKADDNRKLPLDEDLIKSEDSGGLFNYVRNLVKALTGNYNHLANIININDDLVTTNTTNIATNVTNIATNVTNIGTTGAGHVTILPVMYSSITQGTYVVTGNVLEWDSFYWQNSSVTQNDRINYAVYLAVGTYTLKYHYLKASAQGIVDFSLDNYATSEGTIDAYSAGVTYNNMTAITGIVIAAAGLFALSLKTATKNASSSAYGKAFNAITLFRTA